MMARGLGSESLQSTFEKLSAKAIEFQPDALEIKHERLPWWARLGVWSAFFFMAGAILCTKENGHFSIDAASTFLGEKAKKILALVIDVLSCAFLVFLARSGWLLAQRAAAQSSNMLDIPMRLIYSVIPVCAAIMVIYVVRNLVLHIAALRSTDTDGKES